MRSARIMTLPAITSTKACPVEVNPVRQGEPLFADKDMRQLWNLRRFPLTWVHYVNLVHYVIA
jgi:hypothetical protein